MNSIKIVMLVNKSSHTLFKSIKTSKRNVNLISVKTCKHIGKSV